MSAEGNEKYFQVVCRLGFERLGPIALEDKLKEIGFEIDPEKTWIYPDYVQGDGVTAIDCKMIYPKNPENVDVEALRELRKRYFTFINGYYWIF